jgi:tetratricopeptide (TPR) repeat protein
VNASSERHEAAELFRTRQYRAAANVCLELLARRPDDLPLRILRARALMALRCDEEAKRELSRAIRLDRRSGEAHRLLGELAIRCGKMDAAATLLRQAVRCSPNDTLAASLLELLSASASIQPTAAADKLPAAAAAVGCSVPARPRMAIGSHSEEEQLTSPVRARFGRYLVDIGALTPLQLRAALDYHRRAGIRVGAAAVALGFMSEPRVEWAAHDFHASV